MPSGTTTEASVPVKLLPPWTRKTSSSRRRDGIGERGDDRVVRVLERAVVEVRSVGVVDVNEEVRLVVAGLRTGTSGVMTVLSMVTTL